MEFTKKEIVIKYAIKGFLRSPNQSDAKEMIKYSKLLSKETHFMARYPEEVETSIEKQEKYIKDILESPKYIIITAFINEEIAGQAGISCIREFDKMKHRAGFWIGIQKKYWGKGLGDVLIKESLEEARKMGYEQVELGVFSDNTTAIALYEANGFEIWGRSKNAFKLEDGTYHDDIIMGKML